MKNPFEPAKIDYEYFKKISSLYFDNGKTKFKFDSTEEFPLSFILESPEGKGFFSIEKGDYLKGTMSEIGIGNSFRFYSSCRDDIIEAWNGFKSKESPSITQRRYRVSIHYGVISKVTITNHEKSKYYELYYAYNPETKLYSIKGLVGANLPGEKKHLKIVFRMIVELIDFHGTINDNISKKIVSKLKRTFLSSFLVNYKLSSNRSIEPDILKIFFKLRPDIFKQENFDQETIDIIKEKNGFWFSFNLKIRLNNSL